MKIEDEILTRAAQIIERRGLAKGVYENVYGCRCTLGAIRDAAAEVLGVSIFELPDAVRLPIYLARGQEVADWNDKPERTGAEVAKMLRRATRLASNNRGGSDG